MTEPRNPEEPQPLSSTTDDSVTQAWPSLATPPTTSATPSAEAASASASAAAADATRAPEIGSAASPYEPAASLPDHRITSVEETASPDPARSGPSRRGLRWILALAGVVIVALASILIVSLVAARPAPSIALGYMPTSTVSYTEIRLDLPGDQREKVAAFLKPFPGFQDGSAFDAKLNEVLDRLVRAASKDSQTWTTDIAPWFGGQVAFGTGLPDPDSLLGASAMPMMGANQMLFVVTVRDRAKAVAWIEGVAKESPFTKATYGGADLLTNAGRPEFAIAVNDKVILAGSTTAVKAAVDTQGNGGLAADETMKTALATVTKDYVTLAVTNVRAYADWISKAIAKSQPGVLDKTQIDETVLGMLPGWFATTTRFENDALTSTSIGPAGATGYDTSNHVDAVAAHVPPSTILLSTEHDVGPAVSAIMAKFRALPEAKPFFEQFDRAIGVLGGFDATVGWWGDSGIVLSKLPDGTIGGGLVIKPRDAAAASRLATTLKSLMEIGGQQQNVSVRNVDHNGTNITVVDFSGTIYDAGTWPAGYKPEIAFATNADIAVAGIGQAWVESVLDAGPGKSLADDARFKALLDRADKENIAVAFIDVTAIRGLLEPLAQQSLPADSWTYYIREIQPYLKPFDALISTGRKDGTLDRGVTIVTAH